MLSDVQPEESSATDLQLGEARSVFRVDGMDCGECARTVQRVMGKLSGVREVAVSFNTTKMTVVHNASLETIQKTVSDVGYRATVLETTLQDPDVPVATGGEAAEPGFWEKHKRTVLTTVSGLFLGVGLITEFAGGSESAAIVCYLIAILTGGFYAARAGYFALKSFTLDMNFLMTVAAIGAAAIGEWSEGATVVFLFSVGNWLQASTMERTRRSIRSLIGFAPKEALVRRNGQEQTVSVDHLQIGDLILVRPGERIPMDGRVEAGSSTVNQAPVTGESIPVLKQMGDEVFAGTLNETGGLEVIVTKKVQDSTLSRMIYLVEEAQEQKAPSQQFVDRFATYYTPIVVVLAILIAVLPPLFTGDPFSDWIYRALALLVIACPCALVISTPVAIVAAIGNAAKRGVLIKGGAYLELMGQIRAVAFDKTGTLTQGKPVVVLVEPFDGVDQEQLLTVAASIEARSEHPLARAVLLLGEQKGIRALPVQQFQAVAGKGAQGHLDGALYRIGKPSWFEELGYDGTDRLKTVLSVQHEQGHTVMLVADEQQIIGLIAVADTVRPDSADTIAKLKQAGTAHTVMLTGDHARIAKSIAKQVGIDEYHGDLLPEQKLARITELKQRHHLVAMVGDGINDSPALAASDIGIAMGGAGTDIALETADIVLMSDDISKLPFTVRLSRKALRLIKQNIWFSLLVKLAFLLLTVAGLSNLWMAVFADTGAALLVILNGMRLIKVR
ncbi:heavy metal translocating P-type ATPase [Tumebacillus algifaecis]|uniref:Cd(2+)-exporting ATPase n=2 Tax=Tumebacillus algifaecis TaxID=1214604 RepID=A0A223D720_9BACL|nr:heavy metal translocating P-type ATPase [Tumebacillus algifaecis]